MNINIEGISAKALEYLKHRDWPGNVRELQNIIERAMNVCTGRSLSLDDFRKIETVMMPESGVSKVEVEIDTDASLSDKKNNLERDMILQALEYCDYNKSQTAKALGISRTLLYQKIKKYELGSDL